MSHALLTTILSHHGISLTGCRELQEWRLSQFRLGIRVRDSSTMEPNLNKPTTTTTTTRDNTTTQLFLPLDILRHIVLPKLETHQVFTLLYVCKSVSVLARTELEQRAVQLIRHPRATPLALSFMRVLSRCLFDYQRVQLLKVPSRLARRIKNDRELVRLAITRHGYIEHLRTFPQKLALNLKAIELEDSFIASRKVERIRLVNKCLDRHGYDILRIDCISSALETCLRNIGDWAYITELWDFIHMQATRKLDTIIIGLKHPLIIQTLLYCTFTKEMIHYAIPMDHLLNKISSSSLSPVDICKYTLGIFRLFKTLPDAVKVRHCCVWAEDGTITIQPWNKEHTHANIWWLNHVYHSNHFIGP